jgi:hypothetical protein
MSESFSHVMNEFGRLSVYFCPLSKTVVRFARLLDQLTRLSMARSCQSSSILNACRYNIIATVAFVLVRSCFKKLPLARRSGVPGWGDGLGKRRPQ